MTATQKHDIIPICTTVLSADQPPKEDIMLDHKILEQKSIKFIKIEQPTLKKVL